MEGENNISVNLITIEEYEYTEFLKDDVVVTVYLIILCIVGSFGNANAFIVYFLRYKSSTYRTFVLWLAAVDFVACSLSIPFEVMDIRHGFTIESSGECMFFRFINHIVSISSGALLGVIAVERYRKACCPFGRQVQVKESAIACLITIGISSALSTPSFYLYEAAVKETTIAGLVGKDCTVGNEPAKKSFFRVYSGILLIISTLLFVNCIVVYSFVGRTMYRQLTFRKSTQVPAGKTVSNSSLVSGNKIHDCKMQNGNRNNSKAKLCEEESSINSLDAKKNKIVHPMSSSNSTPKKIDRLDRTKRITLMFIIATAVSYIGYVPNLIILMIRAANPSLYQSIDADLGMFTPVLLRGYFLSNVTNPLVYCFVDDRFRREIKFLYQKFKRRILCCKQTVATL